MTDPLAIRIEAALADWQHVAEFALHGGADTGGDWVPRPWKTDGDEEVLEGVMTVADCWRPDLAAFIAAFDPSTILGLITGMRAILADHADDYQACRRCVDVSAWLALAGDSDAVDSLPMLAYPCPTVQSLASMLGLEEDTA